MNGQSMAGYDQLPARLLKKVIGTTWEISRPLTKAERRQEEIERAFRQDLGPEPCNQNEQAEPLPPIRSPSSQYEP